MHKALIFGAAPIKDYSFIKSYIPGTELVLCADGGASHAENAGIKPDIIIGDFDSVTTEEMTDGTEAIRAPKEKDQTDTELAIVEAVRRGIDDIVLFGCIYGRMDHTFATVQLLLKYARMGIEITAAGEDDILRVALGTTILGTKPGYYLSLFALSSGVYGIDLSGVKYRLRGYDLFPGDAIGVSNEIEAENALIEFRSGELLIILSKREEKRYGILQRMRQ